MRSYWYWAFRGSTASRIGGRPSHRWGRLQPANPSEARTLLPPRPSVWVDLLLPYDRHPPAGAEGARGDFQNRGRLLPLELRDAHQAEHPADRVLVVALRDDFLPAMALLHVQFQNFVEQCHSAEEIIAQGYDE